MSSGFINLPPLEGGSGDNFIWLPLKESGSQFISDGLVLWLDAADTSTMTLTGTRVDEWRDKMGSGRKVQTVPALGTGFNPTRDSSLFGGRGGVVFNNASGRYLQSDASFPLNRTNGWTVIMAMTRTSRNGFWQTTDFSGSKPMMANYQSERFGIAPFTNTRYGLPRNIPFVHGTINTGSDYSFIRNGLINLKDQGAMSVGTGALNLLQVGGWQGSAGPAFMQLAGAFYYDRVLTESEVFKMYNWIKANYGIDDVADPTWNIVVDGNSHALGVGGTNVSTINEGVLAANGTPLATDWLAMGTSGITTPELITRAPTRIDPLYNASIASNKRILIMWEGTNHIANTLSADASIFYNAIKDYCIARKTANPDWHIIVGTVLPRGGTMTNSANYESVRTTVNQSIRDALAAEETWLDAIADVGADTTIGESGDSANTTYYNTDQIHLKDAGQTIAATYFRDAINAVTGL